MQVRPRFYRSVAGWAVTTAVLLLQSGPSAQVALADQLVAPVLVATSGSDGPTLGIPRWKGYMLESAPANFWISFANSGGSSNNLRYTTNSGNSWSTNAIEIDGYLDFHLSAWGRNGELFFTMPGTTAIDFRKFSAPAHSGSDAGPLIELPGTTYMHRSNIMVESGGRIWIFTRLGGSVAENVRYFYSDNGGTNWTTSMARSTNAPDVRIGSMPYVAGRPALVVLHLDDARGFEYYLWNGTSFTAPNDRSMYAANMGYVRAFTHNVVNDTTMHLVFGRGNDLVHVWKHYNGGSGAWNVSTVESSPFTPDNDWLPISTVRGDDLYLFYCRKSSDDFSTSMIYYRKWSQASRSWSDAALVSTDPANVGNRDPNTCFQVPESADYIPVFWSSGVNVWFAKIALSAQQDLIPPGQVFDLGQVSPSVHDTDDSGFDDAAKFNTR